MALFTAIALTAIFLKLKMATAWIVWCWIIYGVEFLTSLIFKILKKVVENK